MEEYDKKVPAQGTVKITAQILNIHLRVTPLAWHPATDLFETPDEYIVKVEIAGMNEEDINVNIEGNTLLISGQRPMINPEGAFHRLEIPYGDFSTIIEIPGDICMNKVEAIYQNDFLTINLPKVQPVNIEIK
jgi:HSP20 family protein